MEYRLLTNAAALGASGTFALNAQTRETKVYITFGPGTTGGVVVVEEAASSAEGATWSLLTSVPWVVPNAVRTVAITGAIGAIRVRITTAITGGVVNAWLIGN